MKKGEGKLKKKEQSKLFFFILRVLHDLHGERLFEEHPKAMWTDC